MSSSGSIDLVHPHGLKRDEKTITVFGKKEADPCGSAGEESRAVSKQRFEGDRIGSIARASTSRDIRCSPFWWSSLQSRRSTICNRSRRRQSTGPFVQS